MDATIKAKWVAALRSGRYVQGRGQLRDEGGGWCCLGVLCDVLDARQWVREGGAASGEGRWVWRGEPELVPGEARREVSLHTSDMGVLAYRNDTLRHTFAALADYLEGEDGI